MVSGLESKVSTLCPVFSDGLGAVTGLYWFEIYQLVIEESGASVARQANDHNVSLYFGDVGDFLWL